MYVVPIQFVALGCHYLMSFIVWSLFDDFIIWYFCHSLILCIIQLFALCCPEGAISPHGLHLRRSPSGVIIWFLSVYLWFVYSFITWIILSLFDSGHDLLIICLFLLLYYSQYFVMRLLICHHFILMQLVTVFCYYLLLCAVMALFDYVH